MMGPKQTNFIRPEYPHSMETIYGLIEILKDPKKFTEQVDALKAYIDKANQSIELLGKAEQLDNLLEDAKVKQAKVDELLSNAQDEADKVIQDAKNSAKSILDSANAQVQNIVESTKSMNEQAKENLLKSETAKTEYSKLLTDIQTKQAELDKKEANLKSREDEVKRKMDVLAQL